MLYAHASFEDWLSLLFGLLELVVLVVAVRFVIRRVPVLGPILGAVLGILLAIVTLGILRAPRPGPMDRD